MIFGLAQKITERVDLVILGFKDRPDVVLFLKDHERRPLLEKNLLKEINDSAHVIKDQETINQIIDDFARNFCTMAIEAKKTEMLTENERQRRLQERSQWEEIQKMIEENSTTKVETYDGEKK